MVDKNGFLIAIMVTIANIYDGSAAYLLMRVLKELCSSVKVVTSGYKGHGFRPIQKRWIVERTFSWFDNNRKLCRNYEVSFDSAEEMVKIATIKLLVKKFKQFLRGCLNFIIASIEHNSDHCKMYKSSTAFDI